MTAVATALAIMFPLGGPPPQPTPPSPVEPDRHVLICDRSCWRHLRWQRVVRPLKPTLMRIAWCESTNNPRAVSPDGRYFGLLQFDLQTWASVGGRGFPHQASRLEQFYRGARLYRQRGPAPWPICGYR